MFFIRLYLANTWKKIGGHRARLREKENLFRYRAWFEGNLLRFARARAHVRVLMTRKSCAVGMRNAILRNYLKTQHEVPFINTSEGTNKSSDPTENGKCTYVTNRRISKSCRLGTSFPEINSLTALFRSSFCNFFLLSKRIFRESKASSMHFFAFSILQICVWKQTFSLGKDERYRLTFDWRFGTLSQSEIRVHWWTHNLKKPHELNSPIPIY